MSSNIAEIMGHKVDVKKLNNPALRRVIREREDCIEFMFGYDDHEEHNEEYKDYSDHKEKYKEWNEYKKHKEYKDCGWDYATYDDKEYSDYIIMSGVL